MVWVGPRRRPPDERCRRRATFGGALRSHSIDSTAAERGRYVTTSIASMTACISLPIGWLLVAACSSSSSAEVAAGAPEVAVATPAIRGTAVAVERRAIHEPFAKYHRALLLLNDNREVRRAELSDDIG